MEIGIQFLNSAHLVVGLLQLAEEREETHRDRR
jgi:hypothetical protein